MYLLQKETLYEGSDVIGIAETPTHAELMLRQYAKRAKELTDEKIRELCYHDNKDGRNTIETKYHDYTISPIKLNELF